MPKKEPKVSVETVPRFRCGFYTGTDPKATNRTQCAVKPEFVVWVARDSTIQVCEAHLKQWAIFNGAAWFQGGMKPLPMDPQPKV